MDSTKSWIKTSMTTFMTLESEPADLRKKCWRMITEMLGVPLWVTCFELIREIFGLHFFSDQSYPPPVPPQKWKRHLPANDVLRCQQNCLRNLFSESNSIFGSVSVSAPFRAHRYIQCVSFTSDDSCSVRACFVSFVKNLCNSSLIVAVLFMKIRQSSCLESVCCLS